MSPYAAAIRAVPMPARIAALPISENGFPVPWFVAWIGGVPDFRVIDRGKDVLAHKHRRCWVCGQPMGVNMAMTIGPMCAINRVISEPASHRECAIYAALACPFLANPKARRNAKDLPEDRLEAAGLPLVRNPGAVCVWVTRSVSPFKAPGGILFSFGDPIEVHWFASGRIASREEVDDSIASGLPTLRSLAEAEGTKAVAALDAAIGEIEPYLPPHQTAAGQTAAAVA